MGHFTNVYCIPLMSGHDKAMAFVRVGNIVGFSVCEFELILDYIVVDRAGMEQEFGGGHIQDGRYFLVVLRIEALEDALGTAANHAVVFSRTVNGRLQQLAHIRISQEKVHFIQTNTGVSVFLHHDLPSPGKIIVEHCV